MIYSFSRCAVCHVYTFIKNGTFRHCGRSNVWNSTHHGRYVFQTVFLEKYEHRRVHIHIHNYVHIHLQKYMYIYMCVYAVGWLVVWCGVCVWCVVVVVSLSLVFSNLKLVRSKGFFR